MDQICLVVPILPGRTADAKDFMRELEGGRNADYQRSEQRIGIVKEAWYLARTPAGDQLVAYMESPDFPAGFVNLIWPHCAPLIWPRRQGRGAVSSPLIWPHRGGGWLR